MMQYVYPVFYNSWRRLQYENVYINEIAQII